MKEKRTVLLSNGFELNLVSDIKLPLMKRKQMRDYYAHLKEGYASLSPSELKQFLGSEEGAAINKHKRDLEQSMGRRGILKHEFKKGLAPPAEKGYCVRCGRGENTKTLCPGWVSITMR